MLTIGGKAIGKGFAIDKKHKKIIFLYQEYLVYLKNKEMVYEPFFLFIE